MKVFLKVCAIVVGLLLIGISAAALCLPGPLSPWAGGPVASRIGQRIGARVTIESFRIVPSKLGIEISGLAIANPEGFVPEAAIRVGRVLIQPHLSAFFSGMARIRRIKIEDAEIRLRIRSDLGPNLARLRDQAVHLAELDTGGKVLVNRVDVGALVLRMPDGPAPRILPAFEIKELSGGVPGPVSKAGAALLRALCSPVFQSAGIDDVPPTASASPRALAPVPEAAPAMAPVSKPAPQSETKSTRNEL